MRVLLVEEDLIAARGITLMLKAAGAVVDQTDSGEDALELLRTMNMTLCCSISLYLTSKGLRSCAGCASPEMTHPSSSSPASPCLRLG